MASSSAALLEVPKEVKVNTRAVLLSSKNGVALRRFNRDYKNLLGMASSYLVALGHQCSVLW